MNDKKCEELIKEIEKEKLIAIVRGAEKQKLLPLAEALYRGGIHFAEITFDSCGNVSDEETAENIATLKNAFDGRMHIGAGTVLNERQVELTKNAGGEFIISPDTYPEVIKHTKRLGMVSIPGAFTPSEIAEAVRCGADFVKLFPVVSVGAEYIKAIKAPLSNVRLLAVGGADENNLSEFLDAGVCGFGIGSALASKKLIENGDYEAICDRAKKYVSAVKSGK